MTAHDPNPPITSENSGAQSLEVTGAGGALAGGAAVLIVEALLASIDGGISGGGAIQAAELQYSAQDGALAGGAATVMAEYLQSGASGGIVGGDAVLVNGVVFTPVGGGISGSGAEQMQAIALEMQGGAIAGGTADIINPAEMQGEGGAVAGGEAEIDREFAIPPQVTHRGGGGGRIIFDALQTPIEADIQTIEIIGSGGMVATGSADVQKECIQNALGGAIVQGSALIHAEVDETEAEFIFLLAA